MKFLYMLLVFVSGIASAQDIITFTAEVDKEEITIDEKINLTLTITGSQEAGAPALPSLDGFSIVSQGSSSQFSFINGKMSASKSFTYVLIPAREGKITIAPAVVNIDGKAYKTEPITILVSPSGTAQKAAPLKQAPPAPLPTSPSNLKERIFIEVGVDKKEVYIGEQLTMTFKLYFRNVIIDNLQYAPPVTKGFVTESMGPQKEYQDLVNNAAYNVIELKTAIFPMTEGALTIGPAKLKCNLLTRAQRKRPRQFDDPFSGFFDDSFFTQYSRYPVELESTPLDIMVQPLPLESPDSFRGAVGTYDMQIEASPLSVKAGEPINISMKISGAGNITAVPEPVMENTGGFKIYEPETKTIISGRDPLIAGEKIFQKIIIPMDEAIKEIPAVRFSYFDPAEKGFSVITKGPVPLTVLPAPQKAEIVELIKDIEEEDSKKNVRLLAKDIQYIKSSPGRLAKTGFVWYENILLWIFALGLPLISVFSSLIYKRHRIRLKEDISYAKSRTAFKTAKKGLSLAHRFMEENKPREFYDTVAKAVIKYIGDKLHLAPGAVSIDSLIAAKIPEDITGRIKDFLNKCDLGRFGICPYDENLARFSGQVNLDMAAALSEARVVIWGVENTPSPLKRGHPFWKRGIPRPPKASTPFTKRGIFVLVTGFWLLVSGYWSAFAVVSAYAGTDNVISFFDMGNSFYEKGEYKSAIEKYEEVIKQGCISGPLYYNIGNSYFKLGSLSKTILYYERAKRIMPNDPELKFNLAYVRSLLEDKITAPSGNWLVGKLDSIVRALNPGKWIGLVLTVWLVFCISGLIAVFSAGFRNVFKCISAVSVILLIFGISSILILYSESRSIQAVVLVKEVSVRYGPGDNIVAAFLLHEGTKVSVKNRQEEWLQIQLPDGKSGWLAGASVEEI